MKYAKKTFGLDDTWYKLHFYETTDLIVLLHEIGHMIHHNSLDNMSDCYLINTLSQSDYYKNMINGINRRLAYRKSRCEFKADSIACNIFKKHSIEMLSIITNKTVKELNREKLVYNLNQNKLNKTSKYILERRG